MSPTSLLHIIMLNYLIQQLLFDFVDPAFWRFDASHLDSGERVVELLDDRAHRVTSVLECNHVAVVLHSAYRRNDCCRSAETAFNERRKFVLVDFALLNL